MRSAIRVRVVRTHNYLTSRMKGRLLLYTLILVIFLTSIFTGATLLFGRFNSVEKTTAETLTLYLSIFEQNISTHFDAIAARGIKLSQDLTTSLEDWLTSKNMQFSDLDGKPLLLAELQDHLYSTLAHSLELTECSGAYYMLETTSNPYIKAADHSRSGMYLRLANLNVSRPINPKLVLYRGYTAARRRARQELHNRWALEFELSMFPDYDLLKEAATSDLNKAYLFSDSIRLPGTWEDVVLLNVPLVDSSGNFYGLAGFEISQQYFKLHHAQCGIINRLMGILSREDNGQFNPTLGLQAGDRTGYFVELQEGLEEKPGKYFVNYQTTKESFIGRDLKLRLSPLKDEHRLAILVPKEDFKLAKDNVSRENLLIGVLLLIAAIAGSVQMSRLYVSPILEALHKARSGEIPEKSNIQEINDLFEFLAKQDEVRQQERLELEQQLAQSSSKSDEYVLPSRDAYEDFLQNLVTLTKAEREVFDLYLEGHRAKDMPEILCRSMNTIKTHNKRIYDKLGVSSRYELLAYIQMMKEEGEI